jgi:uncharacterized protein
MNEIHKKPRTSKRGSAVNFTETEANFLLSNEACRVATSRNDTPHVTPVSYVYEDGKLVFATDYNTMKYRNIRKNKKVALVVDIYDSSTNNRAVVIEGIAIIVERGYEFVRWYNKFYQKFEWVRREPWREGEAPFVIVTPTHKVSWGI